MAPENACELALSILSCLVLLGRWQEEELASQCENTRSWNPDLQTYSGSHRSNGLRCWWVYSWVTGYCGFAALCSCTGSNCFAAPTTESSLEASHMKSDGTCTQEAGRLGSLCCFCSAAAAPGKTSGNGSFSLEPWNLLLATPWKQNSIFRRLSEPSIPQLAYMSFSLKLIGSTPE